MNSFINLQNYCLKEKLHLSEGHIERLQGNQSLEFLLLCKTVTRKLLGQFKELVALKQRKKRRKSKKSSGVKGLILSQQAVSGGRQPRRAAHSLPCCQDHSYCALSAHLQTQFS